MELSGVNHWMKRCGKTDSMGPGLRMRQYRPGVSSSPVARSSALIRCRCLDPGTENSFMRRHILQNRLNTSYSGEIWQHFIICPSSRWEIRDTIQSGKIDMIWTWGQKKTMTHLIRKYRHQIFVCSTRMTRNKNKSMASVKLIIMPEYTLNCSSSVSAAAMSNTVRINIHYSGLSRVSPSHGWRLFMRML